MDWETLLSAWIQWVKLTTGKILQTLVMIELDKWSWPSQTITGVLTPIKDGGRLENPVHSTERFSNSVLPQRKSRNPKVGGNFVRLDSERKRRLLEAQQRLCQLRISTVHQIHGPSAVRMNLSKITWIQAPSVRCRGFWIIFLRS